MENSYKGEERRKVSSWVSGDRDLLIRVDQNVDNLVALYRNHVKDDEKQFDEFKNRLGSLEKLVFVGIGIFVVVEFSIRIFVK